MPGTRVLGRRVAAFLFDGLLLWALWIIPFILIAEQVPATPAADSDVFLYLTLGDTRYQVEGGAAALIMLWGLVDWLLVYGFLQGRMGWTPGKALLGVRVVDSTGRPPGIGRSLARSFMWIADAFPYFIPYLTGFIVALARGDRRRLGDLVAGTWVVAAASAGAVASPSPAPSLPSQRSEPLFGPGEPATPTPAATATPPGWHPDPTGTARLRWWDGDRWTDSTAD